MATIINLTPHEVKLVTSEGVKKYTPSGKIARVSMTRELIRMVDGVFAYRPIPGEVVDLPSQEEGTYYIVSALVRTALPNRKDLLSPADFVRDEDGNILGCKSFDCN